MNRDYEEFVKRYSVDDQYSPFQDRDIEAIESALSIHLPTAYTDFVRTYGAVCTPRTLDAAQNADPPCYDVQNFLSANDIPEATAMYVQGGMPDSLVLIASDCMGNVFGFERRSLGSVTPDAPILVFDHDYCEVYDEATSFVSWIKNFNSLPKS
jgi:hypothetical protein